MATEINLVNDDITVNSITDGTATLTGGALTGLSSLTTAGALQGGSVTDGTATLTGGNLSGIGSITGTSVDVGTVTFDNLVGISGATVTRVLDEDNFASNSATALATQQSIKAYVDANAGGGGVTLESVKALLSASSTVNDNGTYTAENIFPVTGSLDINIGSFTSSTSGIVVPSTGTYIVMGNMLYNTTVARANPEFRFSINGTGQSESARSAYMRSAGGHNSSSSSLTTIYTLTAGDEIGLQFRSAAAGGTVNLETTSHVAIYRIS